jgi:hypothetical protein
MTRTIKLCAAALLVAASMVASAHPLDGFWFPDMQLSKERLDVADPAAMAMICSRMAKDGFYVLSILIILEFEGDALRIRPVGGGPAQFATLQSGQAKTGGMIYRSSAVSTERLEIEVTPLPHGALQVRVSGRDTPELNALHWVSKSKHEIERMDADLLAGKAGSFEDMAKACR